MTDPKPKAMSVEEAIHTLGLYLAGDELKHKARAALAVLRGLAEENAALKAELIEANKLAMAHFETSEKFAALIEDLRAELEEHRAELKLVANAVHDFYQGRGNVNTVLDRIHSIIVVSGMEDNARASKEGK